MSKISRDRGKRFELQVAKYLDTKRNHFEAEDIRHPMLSIECKHRKKLPVTMMKWYTQAQDACPNDRIAVVAMHEENQLISDSLVLISLADLKKLLKRIEQLPASYSPSSWLGSCSQSYTGPYTDED